MSREVSACVGFTSRYPIFPYSLFLAIDRVRLGARHTMARAIGNSGLQLERFDNAVPIHLWPDSITEETLISFPDSIILSNIYLALETVTDSVHHDETLVCNEARCVSHIRSS